MTGWRTYRALLAGPLALAAGLLLCAGHGAEAQVTDPELNRQIEQAKAEAEKAKAEAEKAKAEAEKAKARREALSKLNTAEGKVEQKDVVIEAHIRAFDALGEALKPIACDLRMTRASSIVVRSPDDVAGLRALKLVEAQVRHLVDLYPPALDKSGTVQASGGPLLFASLLGSIVDVAALFKTDTTITGVDVSLNNSAVVPQLARLLMQANCPRQGGKGSRQACGCAGRTRAVYYPDVVPYHLTASLPTDLPLLKALAALNGYYSQAQPVVTLVAQVRDLTARLAVAPDEATKKQIRQDLEAAKKALANEQPSEEKQKQLVALNASYDRLRAGLNETDVKGVSHLVKLVAATEMRTLLTRGGTYILELTAQKAGGNNKGKSGPIHGGVSYSGGVVLSYLLFDCAGKIQAAGNESYYLDYVHPDRLKARKDASGP